MEQIIKGSDLILFGVNKLFQEGKTEEEILELTKLFIDLHVKHNKKEG